MHADRQTDRQTYNYYNTAQHARRQTDRPIIVCHCLSVCLSICLSVCLPGFCLLPLIFIFDLSLSPQGIQSGTTVVAVFLRGDRLYASWLGDSQALLFRRGKPVQLVKPHKPDREVRMRMC